MIKIIKPYAKTQGVYNNFLYIKTDKDGIDKMKEISKYEDWCIQYFEKPDYLIRIESSYADEWLEAVMEYKFGIHIASEGLWNTIPRYFYDIIMYKNDPLRNYFHEDRLNSIENLIDANENYESILDDSYFRIVTKDSLIDENIDWAMLLDIYDIEVCHDKSSDIAFKLVSKNDFVSGYYGRGYGFEDSYFCPGTFLNINAKEEPEVKEAFENWLNMMNAQHDFVKNMDALFVEDALYLQPETKAHVAHIKCDVNAILHFCKYAMDLDHVQYFVETQLMVDVMHILSKYTKHIEVWEFIRDNIDKFQSIYTKMDLKDNLLNRMLAEIGQKED